MFDVLNNVSFENEKLNVGKLIVCSWLYLKRTLGNNFGSYSREDVIIVIYAKESLCYLSVCLK